MSKSVLAIFCIALLLTSCQQVEADVPDNPEAHATQSLVEKFIETNNSDFPYINSRRLL